MDINYWAKMFLTCPECVFLMLGWLLLLPCERPHVSYSTSISLYRLVAISGVFLVILKLHQIILIIVLCRCCFFWKVLRFTYKGYRFEVRESFLIFFWIKNKCLDLYTSGWLILQKVFWQVLNVLIISWCLVIIFF